MKSLTCISVGFIEHAVAGISGKDKLVGLLKGGSASSKLGGATSKSGCGAPWQSVIGIESNCVDVWKGSVLNRGTPPWWEVSFMLSGAAQRLVLGLKVASATVDDDRWWVCHVRMVRAKLICQTIQFTGAFASKREVDAFLILWICRRVLDVYAEELLHISRWFRRAIRFWIIVRLCFWDSESTGLLSYFELVYPCFSFTFCWNHSGPTCRKLEKDIEKLKPRRTIDVSQLNDRELPAIGIFQPAFIIHRELLW